MRSRGLIKVGLMAVASGMLAVTGLFAYRNEVNTLVVKRVDIPIKNLNPDLEGFTIAQLSDIHLQPYTQVSLVERAIAEINALAPDLVVYTGDYVWHWAESAYELAPVLAKANSRLGVYAVMGNHDYWTGIKIIDQAFANAHIPVLYNQGIAFQVGDSQLYLAGMDDGWSGKPDLDAALNAAPQDAVVVLLYHEPDLADVVAPTGRVDLQLSGHTHGGQVRFPGKGAMILPYLGHKYSYGLYNVQGMWVYTNGGLGTISIPYRFNCPPEITLLTLISA